MIIPNNMRCTHLVVSSQALASQAFGGVISASEAVARIATSYSIKTRKCTFYFVETRRQKTSHRHLSGWRTSCQFNQDKTEVILFKPRIWAGTIMTMDGTVGNTAITSAPAERNLGVILDSLIKVDQQITSVCRSTYCQIRRIASIRLGYYRAVSLHHKSIIAMHLPADLSKTYIQQNIAMHHERWNIFTGFSARSRIEFKLQWNLSLRPPEK